MPYLFCVYLFCGSESVFSVDGFCAVDAFYFSGVGFPAFFAHHGAVSEFDVGDFVSVLSAPVGFADYDVVFAAVFEVEGYGLSAVMVGDLEDDAVDDSCPDCAYVGCHGVADAFVVDFD